MASPVSTRLRALALLVTAASPWAVPGMPMVASTGATASASTRASPDLPGLRGTWSWPLTPRPVVFAPFVAPTSAYGAGHRGLDVAARQGQPVRAVADGRVTHAGVVAGRGTVTITHPSGLRSTYEPVSATVRVGDVVTAGSPLGVVRGRTHCGGGCLHLGAVLDDGYADPRPLLGVVRVILLPLG